jgi:hypothetical protein
MANQSTGATRSDVGKFAIVNGYSGKGEVIRVIGRTVDVKMPYGIVSTDQENIFVIK